MRRISTKEYDNGINFRLYQQLTTSERQSMRKITLRQPDKTTIKGDVVFNGNNFIFCMKG